MLEALSKKMIKGAKTERGILCTHAQSLFKKGQKNDLRLNGVIPAPLYLMSKLRLNPSNTVNPNMDFER